jgi:imidazolonepropionase-like amidohydrolase
VAETEQPTVAIVGATVIDGNGGEPLPVSTVVIRGARIEAVGQGDSIQIPAGSTRIDAAGKFLLPGLIDTNVHLAAISNPPEQMIRYRERFADMPWRVRS